MAELESQFPQLFSYSMCPLPVHLPSILHEFDELLKASMAPLRSYPGEPFRQILQNVKELSVQEDTGRFSVGQVGLGERRKFSTCRSTVWGRKP